MPFKLGSYGKSNGNQNVGVWFNIQMCVSTQHVMICSWFLLTSAKCYHIAGNFWWYKFSYKGQNILEQIIVVYIFILNQLLLTTPLTSKQLGEPGLFHCRSNAQWILNRRWDMVGKVERSDKGTCLNLRQHVEMCLYTICNLNFRWFKFLLWMDGQQKVMKFCNKWKFLAIW